MNIVKVIVEKLVVSYTAIPTFAATPSQIYTDCERLQCSLKNRCRRRKKRENQRYFTNGLM